MPVSIDGAGSGVSVPSALRSNSMNTLFQISISGSVPVPRDVVDLRAAAARAGVAHLPEVVVGAELEDAVGRHAKLPPDVVGLVVARDAVLALEDRHDQPVRRHLPDVGQQLQANGDARPS